MTKIRVGLLFGGRSGEHEVSIASAAAVMRALDPDKYEAVPMGITREGQWLIAGSPQEMLESDKTVEIGAHSEAPPVTPTQIVRATSGNGAATSANAVDIVFPLLHGPYGEDGTVQGVFETASMPYVGSGVAASAISLDKVHMKHVLAEAGLPAVAYRLVRKPDWTRDRDRVLGDISAQMAYPMFVKPCNLGSSVGISKVRDVVELASALDLATRYDRRIIVEQGIEAREVECGVIGNDEPLVSVAGEVVAHHDFYDYDAKYTDGLADLLIPANLSAEQARRVRELAARAFLAVDAAGLARVDFFIRAGDGEVIVNEINTMPGFTATSVFPRLWEASDVSFSDLVDRLIQLGFDRHNESQSRSVTR